MFRCSTLHLLATLLLLGCLAEGEMTPFIEPYDGQTGVGLDAPLKVHHGAIGVPEGSLPSHLIRVLDLDTGDWVDGETDTQGGHLVFTPDSPWAADHDFHWHVPRLDALPRGPEHPLRAPVSGDAIFSTSLTPDILAFIVEPESACLVLSSNELMTLPVVYAEDGLLKPRWTVVAEGDVLDLQGTPNESPGILCMPSDSIALPARAEWGEGLYSVQTDEGNDLESTLSQLRRYSR